MKNRHFHRTHQPEEPHNSIELEAMKLKHKRDLEKQRVVALISLIVIGLGGYIHTKGDPLGLPLIWTGLGGIGVPIISPFSSPSKNDE